jgi:hypothetical protein
MLRSTLCAAGLIALSLSFAHKPAHAQCVFPFTDVIYGEWRGDDGGTYHMRQIGGDMWWIGMSADNGSTFTNVFHGQVHGKQVTGGWLDVPNGVHQHPTNAGQLILEIDNLARPTTLKKLPQKPDTSLGASKWVRMFPCNDNPGTPR